jgi:hypothetical protein
LENKQFPQRGAIVRVSWKRVDFERPLISQPPDDNMLELENAATKEESKPPGAPEPKGVHKIETPPLAETRRLHT